MRHVCRRCLGCFRSDLIFDNIVIKCFHQPPTPKATTFSNKDHLQFEHYFMIIDVPR